MKLILAVSSDGIMEVKEKEQLEFPEVVPPPGRQGLSDFKVGDSVMAT